MKMFDNRESAQRRWDKFYKPGSSGGASEFGLSGKVFKKATTKDHLKRAAMFGTFGSGGKREDFANALGLLTKHQKKAGNAKGAKVSTKLFNMAIPAVTMATFAATVADGGDGMDFMADAVLPEVGALAGWRTGKSLGYALGTSRGMKTGAKMATGIAGGIAGGIVGGAAFMGAAELVRSASDSNSIIKQVASTMGSPDLEMDFDQNQSTIAHLTNRRRTMDKLSKSGLNDRGQVMGSEAMILKGMM